MTGAPTRPSRALSGLGAFGLLVLVAVVSVVCAALVHDGCFDTPPPVSRPVSGSPRAAYCAAVDPLHPWLLLTIGPLVLAAAMLAALRRRGAWAIAAGVTIAVLLLANAAIANTLTFVYTI